MLTLVVLLVLPACSYYSFTGASIPAEYETVAIPIAEDASLSPIPTLGEALTDRLIDRFVRQTRLGLETDVQAADVVLAARIDRYANEPTAVGGGEQAQQNKVTVAVNVRYVEQATETVLLERTFSSFEQYDPVERGPQGEEEAALAALSNIADDVFTAATSNW